jgi:hypothetical protein
MTEKEQLELERFNFYKERTSIDKSGFVTGQNKEANVLRDL